MSYHKCIKQELRKPFPCCGRMCSETHKSGQKKASVSRLLFVRLNGAVRAVWLAVREPDRLSADGFALCCGLYAV